MRKAGFWFSSGHTALREHGRANGRADLSPTLAGVIALGLALALGVMMPSLSHAQSYGVPTISWRKC